MKKFARTFNSKELGQILIHAVKAGENYPDEPAHLQLCFLHPETGAKCILNDTMSYKKAVKIVNKAWKSTVVDIAIELLDDLEEEDIAYDRFCAEMNQRVAEEEADD